MPAAVATDIDEEDDRRGVRERATGRRELNFAARKSKLWKPVDLFSLFFFYLPSVPPPLSVVAGIAALRGRERGVARAARGG